MSEKLNPAEFPKLAGQWIDVYGPRENRLAKGIPDDAKLIVGSPYARGKPGEYALPCHLCECSTWFDPRDKPTIDANPDIIKICPICLVNLQQEGPSK